MINAYVTGLAAKAGTKVSKIVLTDGRSLGCRDAHLLTVCAGNKLVSEFVLQSDLETLPDGGELLKLKILAALEKLKLLTA